MRTLLIAAAWLIACSAHAAFELRVPEHATRTGAAVTETVWATSVAPFGEYDRIQVHRYRNGKQSRAALLHLPGTNMSGELGPADEDHNFWLFLADRGIEVWALDYRTHAVPNEGVDDLSFMQEWTSERFVDDARLAAEFVRKTSGHDRLFVSGFSRGVWFAYGLVSVAPDDSIQGLIALDGSFKNYRERPFTDYAESLEKLVARKRFASDLGGNRGWKGRHELMSRTYADPGGPALSDRYSSIGVQLSETLYNAWGPGRLANPKEGISRVVPLAQLLDTYDRWWPTVQGLDARSVGGQADDPRTAVDDKWGEFTIPIIYFGSTGMGPDMVMSGIYSASKSGSRDVTINVMERYGHLDILVAEEARESVFEPLERWITDHLQ